MTDTCCLFSKTAGTYHLRRDFNKANFAYFRFIKRIIQQVLVVRDTRCRQTTLTQPTPPRRPTTQAHRRTTTPSTTACSVATPSNPGRRHHQQVHQGTRCVSSNDAAASPYSTPRRTSNLRVGSRAGRGYWVPLELGSRYSASTIETGVGARCGLRDWRAVVISGRLRSRFHRGMSE